MKKFSFLFLTLYFLSINFAYTQSQGGLSGLSGIGLKGTLTTSSSTSATTGNIQTQTGSSTSSNIPPEQSGINPVEGSASPSGLPDVIEMTTETSQTSIEGIDLGQDSGTDLTKELTKEIKSATQTFSTLSSIENSFFARLRAYKKPLRQFGYEFFLGKPRLPTSIPVDKSYTLGPGDEVYIYIIGAPSNMKLPPVLKLTVDREGKLYIPNFGVFYVWGMDLAEAESIIAEALKTNIKLTVGRLRTFPVYVSGEVRRPGSVLVTGVNTVVDALMMAGGIKRTGTLRDVVVTRRTPRGIKKIHIDFYDILLKGKPVDFRVKDGDVIFVKDIGPTAAVAGKVKRPAIYELKGYETIRDLLKIAGGLLPSSYRYKVTLQRYKNNEYLEIYEGKLTDQKFLSQKVKDGDLIFIRQVISVPQNAVSVEGYTPYPGLYQYKEGMKLSHVLKPDMFFQDTNSKFGLIVRQYPPGSEPKYITFVPEDILLKNYDIDLLPADRIILYKFGAIKRIDTNKIKDVIILKGAIKYPGVYAYKKGMKLSHVLNTDQLLIDTNIYFGLIKRIPAIGKPPKYITFSLQDIINGTFDISLKPLDEISFYKFGYRDIDFNKVKDVFVIEGEIKYPGVYAYKKGITLNDIFSDEYLLINTNLYFAEIERRNPKTLEIEKIIKFVPKDVLAGKEKIEIKPMDVIRFYPKYVFTPVKVSGLVEKSAYIPYKEGMKLSEALAYVKFKKDIKKLRADIFREQGKFKGFLEQAETAKGKAETGKALISKNIASIYLYDVLVKKQSTKDILLNPGDRIVIREIDPEEIVERVYVTGYVKNPGVFKIDDNTTLYDVLKAAGGLRHNAYPEGVIILRESVKEMQKEKIAQAILRMKQELEKEEAGIMQADLTSGELKARQAAFEAKRRLLNEMEKSQVTGRIAGIRIPRNLEDLKNSPFNILLENGDRIYIPKKPVSVLVFGEVYNPSALVYVKGLTVKDYIDSTGGLTRDADIENIFVIKADGSVVSSANVNKGILNG
ncbi:MAG: hypothetical protein GXO21_04415, partial [Aquificae bacterium]|nr:hypothetical protein [Aquificota bacterium]